MNPIMFRNVHRAYAERPVLRGLTFDVRPGEVFALLGRNGAGKTTAIRVLLGAIEPMEGSASLFGVDSRALDGEVRERVGFVTEGHALDGLRTVRRTLDFEATTRRRFDRAFAEDRLRRLDLAGKRRVSDLSLGQRAQLALVLALAGRPELLVFDDPGLGLDVVARRELLDAIVDLLARDGVPVLLTTHVLADVERLADRVGILHDGALIVDATRDDLRRRTSVRFLRGRTPAPPPIDGLLGWRRVPDGFEVTLLDPDEDRLRADGIAFSGDGRSPALEDLFVALTATRIAPPGGDEAEGAIEERREVSA